MYFVRASMPDGTARHSTDQRLESQGARAPGRQVIEQPGHLGR
jgi:hypothetical protein